MQKSESHTSAARRKGTFDMWQPRYAERGIATFPVRFIERNGKVDKVPAVCGYMRLGLRGSTELTRKFADADGIGFVLGSRNKIAVVDVDTTDENVVADVFDCYGPSPLVARSPSGGHHVYYRHNGRQHRRIRDPFWQERGAPVDVLGNGFIVAPPSRSPKGTYEFVQGDLDDLLRLTVMQLPEPPASAEPSEAQSTTAAITASTITEGRRNTELWRFCMRKALTVASFAELLEHARKFNEECAPPLEEKEMANTAESAWSYTERGLNRFGQHGAWLAIDEIATMTHDQDALVLLAFLRAHNGPLSNFMCANGLAETFGWPRVRMAEARRRLIELGRLKPVRQAGRGHSALFRWP